MTGERDNRDLDATPERLTAAAVSFLEEETRLIGFAAFVRELARRSDRVRAVAAAALEANPDRRAELESTIDADGPASREFGKYGELLRQTVLVRTVDSYLTYVSETLGEVFRRRPEMLRSEKHVRLDLVLQHHTMDDLISTLAEREVERLAYLGLDDLSNELEKRFGLVLFELDEQRDRAVIDVERRNLIVHNRGVVNGRWVAKVGRDHGVEGDALDLGAHGPWDALVNFHNAVIATDVRLVAKFRLETEASPTSDDPDRGDPAESARSSGGEAEP